MIQSNQGSITRGLAWVGVVIFLALLVGCFAIANDDEESFGVQQVASHEYCDEQYEDCRGYNQEYDQWNSDQNNHNRRNRGAFSPGPFDDSPVDAFNGNTICLPGSTCYTDDRRREEQQPR